MSSYAGWNRTKAVDKERNPNKGRGRSGQRFTLTEHKVRFHLQAPKELYEHPESGELLEFFTGLRYYVRWAGNNGMYFRTNGNSIIDAWRDPEKFNLDLKPLSKCQQLYPADIYYAVSGWVEEWFHIVEKENKNTKAKYKEKELCTGPGCEYCDKKTNPRVFGKKVYLEFSSSQWSAWWLANERAHSRCKCGSIIFTSHYICGGCEDTLYDFAGACYSCDSEELTIDEESEEFNCEGCSSAWSIYPFNNAEFYKEATAKTACQCGHEDVPIPVRSCLECGDNLDDYGLLDYQMKLSSEVKGKGKVIHIEDLKIQEPDPRLFDPKMQSKDADWGEKMAKGNQTPIDLSKACEPMDHDREAEILKIGNPFSMGGDDDNYQNGGDSGQGSQAQGSSVLPSTGQAVVII
jgi:hypothetical protein